MARLQLQDANKRAEVAASEAKFVAGENNVPKQHDEYVQRQAEMMVRGGPDWRVHLRIVRRLRVGVCRPKSVRWRER